MKQFLYSDMEGSKTLLTRKIKVWVYACFSVNQKNQGVGVCVLQGEKSVCVCVCAYRAAIIGYHMLSVLQNRNLCCHRSGG